PLHLEVNLTRSKFEELSDSLIRRTMEPTRQAMKDAGLTNSDIDEVILVGGSTRIAEFKKENGVDLSQDKMALQRLKDAAEKAKKDLSGVSQTQISLPFISAGETGPLHLEVNLTRSKFEELSDSLIRRTMEPTRQAMK
ncbi:hypothetical protein EPU35_25290, partial [Escherichia coli]|uniref:Hsp70 family protein n=1 Tax=Escherichia coli TaxID=562 RepID=UPI000FF418E9